VVFFAIAWAIEWGKEFLGRPFTILFFLGAVLAVLLVRRSAVFWAAVQPPLVAVVGVLAFQYFTAGGFSAEFGRTEVLTILVPLAKRFPLIIVTTIVVIAIALVRAYVLEPDRRPKNQKRGARGVAPAAARGKRGDGRGEARDVGRGENRRGSRNQDRNAGRSADRAAGSDSGASQDSRAAAPRDLSPRREANAAQAPKEEPVEILGSNGEPETTRFAAGRGASPSPSAPESAAEADSGAASSGREANDSHRAVSAAEAARRAKGSRHAAGRRRRSGGGLFGRGKGE